MAVRYGLKLRDESRLRICEDRIQKAPGIEEENVLKDICQYKKLDLFVSCRDYWRDLVNEELNFWVHKLWISYKTQPTPLHLAPIVKVGNLYAIQVTYNPIAFPKFE